MPIINSIVSWLNTKRMYEIDMFKKYPNEVQKETFTQLIISARNSEWGKKHDYKSIRTTEDFRHRVPLQDYDSLKPFIDRLLKGESHVLWSSDIKWFAKSSGTTNDKSKFIPVSKESLEDCHFKGGKDIIAIYTANHPNNGILTGKALTLGGSHQINNFRTDSYFGDLSAILIQNLPFWADFMRTPSSSIALMSEWESKIDKLARATIKENVTNICGVPSWTLVLIKYILNITGKKHLLDVWPKLELFTHGGVSFVPYREQFKELIPSDKMNYLETYNASEGFFAIQDDPQTDDMLLMLDYGIYYEFIPIDQVHTKNPNAIDLADVETGKNYAIVISTNAGLWRYVIGDTVTFTSVNPYKIKITGRTKHFINAFGEELIIDNAEKALKIACEKADARIREYTAAPVYIGKHHKGAHEWLFEFEKAPADLEYFKEVLDNALKSLNSDYEAKRYKNMTLDVPKIKILNDGVFYQWLKNKNKLGGQNKVPRLSNNRDYVDELLKIDKHMK